MHELPLLDTDTFHSILQYSDHDKLLELSAKLKLCSQPSAAGKLSIFTFDNGKSVSK